METHSTVSTQEHIASLDGLRGVAVAAVIAFHLFPQQLPGGFVGVDLFFTISGYIISRILLQDIAAQRYSLAGFYRKRIRRIFPALLAVFAAVLALGCINLFAPELKRLSEGVFWAGLFVANVFAITQRNYFDPVSDFNPTLHLWSLGIEEQFYLVWPVFLALCQRRRIFLPATLVVLAASLAACLWLAGSHATANFYLPFTRFWELLAGALVAYLQHRPQPVAPGFARSTGAEAVTAISLAVLAGFLLALPAGTVFPGWASLAPVLAAVGLVATLHTRLARLTLGQAWLARVGLISYPLYLWHWPLISLARYSTTGEPPDGMLTAGILVATVGLSMATYQWVEKPLRFHASPRTPWALGAAMVVVMAAAVALYASQGWQRRSLNQQGVASVVSGQVSRGLTAHGACPLAPQAAAQARFCDAMKGRQPDALLWGDSHAAALYPGLVASPSNTQRWALVGGKGANCLPAWAEGGAAGSDCERTAQAVTQALQAQPGVKTVLLVLAGRAIDAAGPAMSQSQLGPLVARLLAQGRQVALLISIPRIITEEKFFNTLCFSRPLEYRADLKPGLCSVGRAAHLQYLQPMLRLVQQLKAAHPALLVIDPTDDLCDAQACAVVQQGRAMYSYTDHLSDTGALRVAQRVHRALAAPGAP